MRSRKVILIARSDKKKKNVTYITCVQIGAAYVQIISMQTLIVDLTRSLDEPQDSANLQIAVLSFFNAIINYKAGQVRFYQVLRGHNAALQLRADTALLHAFCACVNFRERYICIRRRVWSSACTCGTRSSCWASSPSSTDSEPSTSHTSTGPLL